MTGSPRATLRAILRSLWPRAGWVGSPAPGTRSTPRHPAAAFGGGGLFTNAGTVTLSTSRVVTNRATGGVGGGILNNGSLSALHLHDTPVTGNRAAETAGGILNGGRVTATRSPVTGNLPNNCAGSPSPVPGCAG
ncbi:hypothetical protein [Streptomyces sp. 184]|uniref:hypothetical protein n=1 Tax=Streptomyces sp. 184 TaxID=1827526 RepID=UPI0038919DF9